MRSRLVLLFFLVLCQSCASPIADLWPPKPGTPSHRITVAMDAWHSVVGVWPADDRQGAAAGKAREWGFADRNFYLMRDDSLSGCCGALFWPTDAVIRVAPAGYGVIDRKDAPPRRWTFRLSEEGYRRLVRFLEEEKADSTVISRLAQSDWYAAKHNYQAFHHCNHWTTRVLRTAGLPVWTFYGMFKWSFEAQLDRAANWSEKVSGSN